VVGSLEEETRRRIDRDSACHFLTIRRSRRGVTQAGTVTKIIDALPGKFEIKVGGNTAPKMISLERAVEAK
jgi:hypothetical protein